MDPWNTTDGSQPLLSNCSVDTSYRFIFYRVSYSIIFFLGLATNSLALHRLCVSGCSMTSTAVYMFSLSAADLCFVISLPLRIFYYHHRARALFMNVSWTPGADYCQLTFTLKYISLYGGIFFLVCIAVDRYFAVVHPLASPQRRLRAAQLVCGGIWCLVLGLSASLLLLRSAATHTQQPCLLDPSSPRHRTIILSTLGLVLLSFLLPTFLLVYSYCHVLRVLLQKGHRSAKMRRSRRHTLRVIYWILCIFLLCFAPYHINLLVYTLTHVGLLQSCGLATVTKLLHPAMLVLASSNCCLNPIIYCFSSSLIQREVSQSRGDLRLVPSPSQGTRRQKI
ncbi:lysophosphatidic acid receptor 6 [Synchiropus picturatus]